MATNKSSNSPPSTKKQTLKSAMLRKVSLLHSNSLQAKYLSLHVQMNANIPDFALRQKDWQAIVTEFSHASDAQKLRRFSEEFANTAAVRFVPSRRVMQRLLRRAVNLPENFDAYN
jgi:hypothetical protein